MLPVPSSFFLISIILSTYLRTLSLWVIIILVQFLSRFNNSITFCYEKESREDVGSSSKITFVFRRRALIIEILCFSPPENMFPFSPTLVWYWWGRSMITSWSPSALAYSSISYKLHDGLPYWRFYRTVPLKR